MAVRCPWCGVERVTGDLSDCPECGKPPYPHKTTAQEFQENAAWIVEQDSLGRRLAQSKNAPEQ